MPTLLKRLPDPLDSEAARLQKLTEAILPSLAPDIRRQVMAFPKDSAAVARVKWERAVTERLASVSRYLANVESGGPLPPPPLPPPVYSVYWGNYVWPDRSTPDVVPTFVEGDFTGVNALFVDRMTAEISTRVGVYEFAARGGVRQVIWLPDALGTPMFRVGGAFPWELTPRAGARIQSLTEGGIPGGVYLTAQQNSGGNTEATGDAIYVT